MNTRITSYNVCYTKLLRFHAALGDEPGFGRGDAGVGKVQFRLPDLGAGQFHPGTLGKGLLVINTGLVMPGAGQPYLSYNFV